MYPDTLTQTPSVYMYIHTCITKVGVNTSGSTHRMYMNIDPCPPYPPISTPHIMVNIMVDKQIRGTDGGDWRWRVRIMWYGCDMAPQHTVTTPRYGFLYPIPVWYLYDTCMIPVWYLCVTVGMSQVGGRIIRWQYWGVTCKYDSVTVSRWPVWWQD